MLLHVSLPTRGVGLFLDMTQQPRLFRVEPRGCKPTPRTSQDDYLSIYRCARLHLYVRGVYVCAGSLCSAIRSKFLTEAAPRTALRPAAKLAYLRNAGVLNYFIPT